MISPGMQFLASSWHDFYSFAPLPISNGRLDSILMFTRPTEREGRSSQWVAGNCHATMRPVRYWSWSACFGPAQLVVATFPAAVRSLVGVRDREWIIITKSLLMWCNFWSSALHDDGQDGGVGEFTIIDGMRCRPDTCRGGSPVAECVRYSSKLHGGWDNW